MSPTELHGDLSQEALASRFLKVLQTLHEKLIKIDDHKFNSQDLLQLMDMVRENSDASYSLIAVIKDKKDELQKPRQQPE